MTKKKKQFVKIGEDQKPVKEMTLMSEYGPIKLSMFLCGGEKVIM